jgi:hypothetical protein
MNAKTIGAIGATAILIIALFISIISIKPLKLASATTSSTKIVGATNVYINPNIPGDPTATMEKSWITFSDGTTRSIENPICPLCGEYMLIRSYHNMTVTFQCSYDDYSLEQTLSPTNESAKT